MNPLFPQLPEDLSALTDEQLNEFAAAHEEAVRQIRENAVDPTQHVEFIGERSASQVLAEMTSGVEALEAIRAEQTSREEAAETYTNEISELAGRVEAQAEETPEDETPDETPAETDEQQDELAAAELPDAAPVAEAETAPEAETAEVVETADEPEPVAASAEAPEPARRMRRRSIPPASAAHQPVVADGMALPAQLVASSGLRSVPAGTVFDASDRGRAFLAQALSDAADAISVRAPGTRETVVVASARYSFPEERTLTARNPERNGDKIRAITHPTSMGVGANGEDVLVASGGFCAPFTPLYDLPILADDDTPVEDALPRFGAARGGITFPTPIGIADARPAITRVTAEDDAEGGTFAAKACLVIDCDPFQEAVVDAVAGCVEWGNFGARAWPERVQTVGELVQVAHAEETEIGLLDGIDDGSTAATGAAIYGAASTLLNHILLAAAAYRSRNRMNPSRVLRAMFPAWVVDMLVADLVASQFERFERSQAGVEALLRSFRVEPVFFMDGATGGGQVFGAQSPGGALTDWPNSVIWYLFAEGTWILLDMGRIDLGIVRDSVLNEVNDYQVFFERFLGIAKTGVESIKVTSTICPDGSTSGPDTIITCS